MTPFVWRVLGHSASLDIDQSSDDEIDLVPTDNTRFRIVFISIPEEKWAESSSP